MKIFLKKRPDLFMASILLVLISLSMSCSKYEVKSTDGPAFSAKAQAVVFERCVSCHAGGQAEGGLGFIDNPSLLFKEGYIVPGNPEGSLLYQKIGSNPPNGDRMPLGGPYLSESQIADIGTWVSEFKGLIKVSLTGTRVTLNPESVVFVEDGGVATISVKAEEGAALPDTVEGTCALGAWNTEKTEYTTGALTQDCTVIIKALKKLKVTPSKGTNVTSVTPEAVTEVLEGKTLAFTVVVPTGFRPAADGTCAAGSWSGETYTTGKIEADCTVNFTGGKYKVTISSTPLNVVGVGERQVGNEVVPINTTIAVKAALNSSAAANPSYTISQTVGGTCPAGSWNGSTYSTGSITGDCTVIFTVQNPCSTAISSVSFASDVKPILQGTNAASSNCTSAGCHGAVSNKAAFGSVAGTASYATLMDNTGAISSTINGTIKHTSNGNNTVTGGYSVVANDPLNSWLYRKVSTSWLGGSTVTTNGLGRMPRMSSFVALSQTEQDRICNWIWSGALNN